MAEYAYINNLSKKGKLGISSKVFDQLVEAALLNVEGISKSKNQLKKNQKFRLNRPVQTTIKNGIVHVWVAVDVAKGNNILDISRKIQDEISISLMEVTETIPFDIQVKAESII